MRPARRDTRTDILELAETLFHERGFNGFSYQDIADKLGVKSAAIHYHYPSKADLGVAIIQRMRDLIRRAHDNFETQGTDPRAGLEAYFAYYLQHLCHKCHSICTVGIMAAELNTVPDVMRSEAQGLVRDIHELLTHMLTLGRERGLLTFQGAPKDRAIAVVCTVGGATQFARIAERPDILETAIAQVRLDLGLAA